MLGDGLFTPALLAAYAADLAAQRDARPEVRPPAMGRDTSLCRAGCVGCPLCAGKVRPLVALRSDEAPADDRAELVTRACVELAEGLSLRWAVRLLATLPATQGGVHAELWRDISAGVAKTARGDAERSDLGALARAARAMAKACEGTGDVDEAAATLAYVDDCDATVAGWYAARRAER